MHRSITALPIKPSRLQGLSERLIDSHYVNNYGGAARRLVAIEAGLAECNPATGPGFRLAGLMRERLAAQNSMLLHEHYFAALGGDGSPPNGPLAAAIERDFGSFAAWRARFVALARALAGGSGWALLMHDSREGRLVNQWAPDHLHALAGARPVLALDMYEHAYHLDFGADASGYIEAVLGNLDWSRLARLHTAALAGLAPPLAPDLPADELVTAEALRAGRDDLTVLDVRLAADRAKGAARHRRRWLVPGRGAGQLGSGAGAWAAGRRLLRLWLPGKRRGGGKAAPARPQRASFGRWPGRVACLGWRTGGGRGGLTGHVAAGRLRQMGQGMAEAASLGDLLDRARRIVLFTGAGISTESGIPDFRSPGGLWSRYRPIEFGQFMASEGARREAWRRKFAMDAVLLKAEPNRGHRACEKLVRGGRAACVITQNIDGLHQGSGIPDDKVIELHGNGTYAKCLVCETRYELAPIRQAFLADETLPTCRFCGGTVKAATISFGQGMPQEAMRRAERETLAADLFIAIGSSLVVYPAAGFPMLAKRNGAKLAIVNREPTEFDPHADLVLNAEIGTILGDAVGVN